jgi:hypothetical protein
LDYTSEFLSNSDDGFYDPYSPEEQLLHREETMGICSVCGKQMSKRKVKYSQDYLDRLEDIGINPCLPWSRWDCECGNSANTDYDVLW